MTINTTKLTAALDARIENDDQIHAGFIELAESACNMDKKSLLTSDELKAVFQHPAIGRAAFKQAISWLQAFTPIRIKFKDNGHFEKLAMAKKVGPDAWDIAGMEKSKWYDHEAVRTSAARKADRARAVNQLIKEAAMLAFETDDVLATMDMIRATVNSSDFAYKLAEHMRTDKFAEWASAREADIAKAKKEAAQSSKKEITPELAEKIAKLQAA